jgi:hypothetical protein
MKEPEAYWSQSRSEFECSVAKVIQLARHQIILYDQSFEDWPFESKEFSEILAHALVRIKEASQQGSAAPPLTMLVRQTEWLEKRAPRWARIRRTYPSIVSVKQVPGELGGNECIIIVDQQHAVFRPHKDSFRAKTIIAQPSEVENRLAKLRQLAELSTICLPTTTLGL